MINQIIKLRNDVETGTWQFRSCPMWSGADVLVREVGKEKSDKVSDENTDKTEEMGNLVVTSQYAWAISSLFYEIKELFKDQINFLSKYEFYGRLGEAALRNVGTEDKKVILTGIVDEALQMAYEMLGKPYFAYGSNIDTDQMDQRCPKAIFAGKVRVEGYRFLINSRGVATLIPDAKEAVEGILWWILPEDEENLDRYEGVRYGTYRKEYPVEIKSGGKRLKPLIYFAENDLPGRSSSEYLGRIIKWARIHDFDPSYIEKLKTWI